MNEQNIICAQCGAKLNEENTFTFDGHAFCEECYNSCTTICDNCGDRIWRESAEGDSRNTLCSHCYQYCYTNCDDCGRLIHNDDAYYEDDDSDYPYCYECYQRRMRYAIKNYSYKPDTIFYGNGNLYYGIELEIDKGGELDSNAQKILDVGNCDGEKIYCKHDGSINNGFEIVSHAATIDYHLNQFPWRDIMTKAIEMGYCSHNTKTCGLHTYTQVVQHSEILMRSRKMLSPESYTLSNFTGMKY